MQLLKNPIVLSVISGILVYLFLQRQEKINRKKDPKIKKKPVNLLTPAVVAVIIWLIASSYTSQTSSQDLTLQSKQPTNILPTNLANKQDLEELKESMLGGQLNTNKQLNSQMNNRDIVINSIKLPPTDVFIDLARFD